MHFSCIYSAHNKHREYGQSLCLANLKNHLQSFCNAFLLSSFVFIYMEFTLYTRAEYKIRNHCALDLMDLNLTAMQFK